MKNNAFVYSCIKLLDYFVVMHVKQYYMDYIVALSFSKAVNSNSASAAVGNGCPLLPSNSSIPLLSVTPRVSGLERSQESSMEQPYPEPISTSSSLPSLAAHSTASVSNSLPDQRNGNGGPHHRHDPSPPQHKHKPFLPFHGKSQSIYSMGSNNRSVW